MSPSAFILIALLKTTGEGGTLQLPYDSPEACEAAGQKLEAQFEAVPLEHDDGTPAQGHARVIWTCFESPVEG